MPNPYTIPELKRIIAPIARKHGVKRVAVFGSIARGEAHAGSDVDLLIEKGKIRTMFQLGGFYADIEDALQCPFDLVTTGIEDDKFLRVIHADEVTIYEQ